jgi:hypothetical protein
MVKLAEVLIERKDLQVKLRELTAQMSANVMIQEGDKVTAEPGQILQDFMAANDRLQSLIAKVNAVNNTVIVDRLGGMTLTQAIEKREALRREHSFLNEAINVAESRNHMYSRTEIKMVRTIDLPKYHKLRDDVAKSIREYDIAIQETNWATEVE